MKDFIRYCIPIAVISFGLMMMLGNLVGEGAYLIGGLLAVGALASIGICLYQKLETVEEKLDKLLEEQGKGTKSE